MKEIFIALLLCSAGSRAQTTARRDPANEIGYEIMLAGDKGSIVLLTYNDETQQDKKLVLNAASPTCPGGKGFRIRLDNGENIIADNVEVSCTPYIPGRSNVSATILLTDEIEAKLTGREIVEFTLAGFRTTVKYKEENENLVSLFKWVREERGF